VTDRADKKGHDRDTAGTFVAEGEQDAENPANKYPPQAEDVNDFGNAEKAGFDVHGSVQRRRYAKRPVAIATMTLPPTATTIARPTKPVSFVPHSARSTALHLRYDVRASSLPGEVKDRLLQSPDQRISGDGIVIIKAQRYRSQERNREDAIARLREIVEEAAAPTPEPVLLVPPGRPSGGASTLRSGADKPRRGRRKLGDE